MSTHEGLLILGFGGHARSVADVALSLGYKKLLFIDENASEAETFLGHLVQTEYTGKLPDGWGCIPAAGDNIKREQQLEYARKQGWKVVTLIAPSATVGVGASIGKGSFIAHHSHVGPMADIGAGCILNTSAIIEHDCIVADYSHLSVNSVVAGRTKIGKYVFLGAGGCIKDGISIVDHVEVGAGGVVIHAIDDPGTYVGIPVKKVCK